MLTKVFIFLKESPRVTIPILLAVLALLQNACNQIRVPPNSVVTVSTAKEYATGGTCKAIADKPDEEGKIFVRCDDQDELCDDECFLLIYRGNELRHRCECLDAQFGKEGWKKAYNYGDGSCILEKKWNAPAGGWFYRCKKGTCRRTCKLWYKDSEDRGTKVGCDCK